jgi:hypothetical protein
VRREHDQDNVYVTAVMRLLERDLLRDARRYIHGHMMKATELILGERFVHYIRSVLTPLIFLQDYTDITPGAYDERY